jgi:spermidine synthase
VVFEASSPYHQIRVVDEAGRRTLLFNRSEETRMSLANPLEGHFEYVEYFLLPWVWNSEATNVLMIGLGGGSAQRLVAKYCPAVSVYTVEVDPVVQQVARDYFSLEAGPRQRVFIEDGRQFLRRNPATYGVILLDAYTEGRYGASLPHHLVTQEFFTLARDRLEPNGVLAYNVMGSLGGWRADIVGSIYRTLKTVFPHVYLFPARESQNVVLIATRDPRPATLPSLSQQARTAYQSGKVLLPTLGTRLAVFRAEAPSGADRCPVLTDDYAPVDGLLSEGRQP